MSNAIKFTPNGGTIHVGAAMQGRELVMDVSDDGPGVDPEDGDRIFEAFYQGRRPQGGPVGGTGIGLVGRRRMRSGARRLGRTRARRGSRRRAFSGAAAVAAVRGQALAGGGQWLGSRALCCCRAARGLQLVRRRVRNARRNAVERSDSAVRRRPAPAEGDGLAIYLQTLREPHRGRRRSCKPTYSATSRPHADTAPTTTNRLKLALALATPTHPVQQRCRSAALLERAARHRRRAAARGARPRARFT